jgi:rhodanese-related sulfurtransferase
MAALPHVSREALWAKIERGDPFVLVDALPPMSYAASHLPGAVNIPPQSIDDRAPRALTDYEAEIVVYCSGSDCDSSIIVGQRLIELGYRNVLHYVEGKSDWAGAGLPLEGGRV